MKYRKIAAEFLSAVLAYQTLTLPIHAEEMMESVDKIEEVEEVLQESTDTFTIPESGDIVRDGIIGFEECPWTLDSNGTLTIGPGTINNFGGRSPWENISSSIKYVTTSGEVTLKNDCTLLFGGLNSVEYMDLSNWNTSSVTDMGWMFYDCTNLKGLSLLNWKTSTVTDMSYMFGHCSNLATIDVANWETSAVTTMEYMFYDCSNLSTLDVSNWDTHTVVDMEYMFCDCSNLNNIDVSSWKTYYVTDMSYMFAHCSELTNLDVSDWDMHNITEMDNIFNGCSKLESLDVSNWNTSSAAEMSGMFRNCKELTDIDVSSWDTHSAKSIGYMFYGCSKLKSIDVSNWNTSHVTYMGYIFYECSKLKNIDVSRWDTSSNYYLWGMFSGCISLTSIDISNWNILPAAYLDEIFNNCSKLMKIHFGSQSKEAIKKLTQTHDWYLNNMGPYHLNELLSVINDISSGIITSYNLDLGPNKESFFESDTFKIMTSMSFFNTQIKYLVQSGNFTASLLVANKDNDFTTSLVAAYSNLYFRGIDGWKEIISGESTKDEATNILLAYIVNSSEQMEKIEAEKELFDLTDELSSAMKMYLGRDIYTDMAAADLVDDSNLLSTLLESVNSQDLKASSAFSNALLEGDIDGIVDALLTNHPELSHPKVAKVIGAFMNSATWIDRASNYLENCGYIAEGVNITAQTLNKFVNYNASKNVDQEYIELLNYIETNGHMEVIRRAAKEVKGLIEGKVSSLEYVLQDAIQAGADIGIKQALELIGTEIPCIKIIQTAFDAGSFLGNTIFHVTDLQESYDKTRCAVYLNQDLASYSIDKHIEFLTSIDSGDEQLCANKAYSLLYVLNMLAQGRINAENTMQSYLELIWGDSHKELMELSRTIEYGIKDTLTFWDMENLLLTSEVASFSCPIDITVKDRTGNVLFTLKDGIEVDGETNGIRYRTEQIANTGEYQKLISFDPSAELSIEATANDLGSVDYIYHYSDEEGNAKLKSIRELSIQAGDQISINNLSQNTILQKNNGSFSYTPDLQDPSDSSQVTDIHVDEVEVTLKVGERKAIIASVVPENTQASNIIWASSNPEIISVTSDGVIEAKGSGSAVIKGVTLNKTTVEIVVNVPVNNTGGNSSASTDNKPSNNSSSNTGSQMRQSVTMYRLYNPNSGEHFYTGVLSEKSNLISLGWKDEGIGWTAPFTSDLPVFRLYNANAGDHHYTMDKGERDILISLGWNNEGIGWYSDETNRKPLYRQYNPNAITGSHNYTINKQENDYLASIGWKAEGIAWYAMN